jgi:cell division protein FtsQ
MDFGGRFFESMSRRASPDGVLVAASPSKFSLLFRRVLVNLSHRKSVRAAEVVLTILIDGGAVALGTVRGGHMPVVNEFVTDIGDRAAYFAGFEIADADVRGHNRLRREEILAAAGITPRTSLVLLNADIAREKLKTNPWIADAVVRKFYPTRIEIEVTEREAFALWQRNGKLAIVSRDGTVLEEISATRTEKLPLVVGEGAARAAADFLSVLDRFPAIKAEVYGAVFIAERRWNLRMTNGVDVRLPEQNLVVALEALTKLSRDQKIFSRDVEMIDLRIPGQVVVRMSDAAASAYDAQRKPTKAKGAS